MKEIKDDVKAFRKAASDSEEVASTLAKDVLKIARRIEYASIFPTQYIRWDAKIDTYI
jgi:taurine transport system permease protein